MPNNPQHPIDQLIDIMQTLRDPQTGCPWDIKQTFETIAPYTVEEAYEVTDAIEKQDFNELKNELGDLLLQVLFHSQMADEAGYFNLHDVMQTLADKMIRRHPHVFPSNSEDEQSEPSKNAPVSASAHGASTTDERISEHAVKQHWEAVKQQERAAKTNNTTLLHDIGAMPALMRAHKLQKRVASVGFDWPNVQPVLDKVREELAEVEAEVHAQDTQKQQEEVGDLLFVVANLARHLGFNAEQCLQQANVKFIRRFNAVEQKAQAANGTLQNCHLDELNALWNKVKSEEV